MFSLLKRIFTLSGLIAGVSLLLFGSASADPAGRTTTINVWVPDSFAWGPALVGPGRPHCYPSNPNPGDECESGGYDGSKDSDPRCPGLGGPPCADGQRYNLIAAHWESQTITYPPATVAASFSCVYGLNGWCIAPGVATITGSEPVAGYSINRVAWTQNGVPAACDSSSCSVTVGDTAGDSFSNFQSFSTYGDSSYVDSSIIVSKVDTTPPQTTPNLAGLPGDGGWYRGPVTVSFSASDATSGVAATEASVDGGAFINAAGGVTVSGEGLHTVAYRSRDAAGNQEADRTLDIQIDSVAPGSVFTSSYTANQWVSGVVNLAGSTTDATSGVAAVSISIDGVNWIPLSVPTWSYAWNTTTWPDGRYSVQIKGQDNAGNEESPAPLILNVDNTAPEVSVSLNCPLPGKNGWCWAPVRVTIQGSDAGSGAASLSYEYRDAVKTINTNSTMFVEGQGGTFQVVNAFVVDALGQQSASKSATFKIDGAPPALSFTGGDSSGLAVSVADSESGVERWTLQVFDADGQSMFWRDFFGPFTGSVSWESVALPAGAYAAEIFAGDHAGLENHLGRFDFTLARTPTPTATHTTVAARSILPSPTVAATLQPTASATPLPTATTMPSPTPAAVAAVVSPLPAPTMPASIPVNGVAAVEAGPDRSFVVWPFLSLTVFVAVMFLAVWLLNGALDRRPSALHALAADRRERLTLRRRPGENLYTDERG